MEPITTNTERTARTFLSIDPGRSTMTLNLLALRGDSRDLLDYMLLWYTVWNLNCRGDTLADNLTALRELLDGLIATPSVGRAFACENTDVFIEHQEGVSPHDLYNYGLTHELTRINAFVGATHEYFSSRGHRVVLVGKRSKWGYASYPARPKRLAQPMPRRGKTGRWPAGKRPASPKEKQRESRRWRTQRKAFVARLADLWLLRSAERARSRGGAPIAVDSLRDLSPELRNHAADAAMQGAFAVRKETAKARTYDNRLSPAVLRAMALPSHEYGRVRLKNGLTEELSRHRGWKTTKKKQTIKK